MIWTDEEIESILDDEDFDISAIYVLGDGEFNLNKRAKRSIVLSRMR